MSSRLHADLVCQALKTAYVRRKPPPGVILHSDRGSQYASARHRQMLNDFRMMQSMSRRANCWDTQSKIALNVRPSLTRAGTGALPLR
jgi:putative transposase